MTRSNASDKTKTLLRNAKPYLIRNLCGHPCCIQLGFLGDDCKYTFILIFNIILNFPMPSLSNFPCLSSHYSASLTQKAIPRLCLSVHVNFSVRNSHVFAPEWKISPPEYVLAVGRSRNIQKTKTSSVKRL
jgi:hypothetical protein